MEQEMIGLVATAALFELAKMEKKHVKVSSPLEILKQLFQNMINPQPCEEAVTLMVAPTPPAPEILPDFPRLLVSYGQGTNEYAIVNSWAEWNPLHHWFTVWPPSQPAGRAVMTTLEQEVERLKSEGLRERPKEEHERRRATKGYTI